MSEAIQTEKQFTPPTPDNEYRRWILEIGAAKEAQKDFWEQGDEAIKEFRAEKGPGKRLNLWYADVETKEAVLSGAPRVRSKRRYADPNDEVARVSAEALDRLLNADTEKDSDGFRRVLQKAKSEWIKTGFGLLRFRLTFDTEKVAAVPAKKNAWGVEVAPAVPAREEKRNEQVDSVWVYWRDVLWSPCRDWSEVRWVDFPSEITRDAAAEMFGAEVAEALPMKKREKESDSDEDKKAKDAWQRIQLHEIWSKEKRERIFLVEGYNKILRTDPDPLQLPGFFPCPEPLSSNLAPGKFSPQSSYHLSKDQYGESHTLTTRIGLLVKALRVAGVYDKTAGELKRLLEDGGDNDLIPCDNWAAFAEKGGMPGVISFLPIKEIVEVVERLVLQRNVVRQTISEVQGISDIMRGESAQRQTATEVRTKSRFGSARIQSAQEVFARFASEAQRIRAQIISKWFSAETIAQRSNMQNSGDDANLLPQAIQLLKSDIAGYRIEVDADQLSMTDYDSIRQERTEGVSAMAGLFQQAVPFIQITAAAGPGVAGAALDLVIGTGRWLFASMRGASGLESEFDKFSTAVKKAAQEAEAKAQAMAGQPPPPDPQVQAEQIKVEALRQKAQIDQQKAGMDMQGKAMDLQIKREELGMKREAMAMDRQAKAADHAYAAQERADEHAMAAEERSEEHAMHREEMRMGMEASEAQHKQKIEIAKMKPKPKGKED